EDSTNAPTTASKLAAACPVFIGLGDYTHSNASNGINGWAKPLAGKPKWGCYGNHEDCSGCLSAWQSWFGMSNRQQSLPPTSNTPGVTFLVLDSGNGWPVTPSGYANVATDGQAAKNRGDWIIALVHKPIYTAPSSHSADEGNVAGAVPTFESLGAALVLEGHNHNYQRSHPLIGGVAQSVSDQNNYDITKGVTYCVVGTGDDPDYSLSADPTLNQTQFTGVPGFLK